MTIKHIKRRASAGSPKLGVEDACLAVLRTHRAWRDSTSDEDALKHVHACDALAKALGEEPLPVGVTAAKAILAAIRGEDTKPQAIGVTREYHDRARILRECADVVEQEGVIGMCYAHVDKEGLVFVSTSVFPGDRFTAASISLLGAASLLHSEILQVVNNTLIPGSAEGEDS